MITITVSTRTMSLSALFFLLAVLFFAPVNAIAEDGVDETVASVKTVNGDAFVLRGCNKLQAKHGDHLYKGDTLSTASNSSIGVIFRDETMLSLGSKSEVCIDDFAFSPADNSLKFLVKVGKGTAQFISGEIAKLAPEQMLVETPLSTIGIRGTRFLVKVD